MLPVVTFHDAKTLMQPVILKQREGGETSLLPMSHEKISEPRSSEANFYTGTQCLPSVYVSHSYTTT